MTPAVIVATSWSDVAFQGIALLAAVFAFYKAQRSTNKADAVHDAVVDVKRATNTNRRATDEAADPVKPDPSGVIGQPHRRRTDTD